MDHGGHDHEKGGFVASRANIALVGFLAIAGFFLVSEHRAHLLPYLGYWPLLLVFACPLLHVFMHGGHGSQGDDGNSDGGSAGSRQSDPPHQH